MQIIEDGILGGLIKVIAAVLGYILVPGRDHLFRIPAHQRHIGRIDIGAGAGSREIVGIDQRFVVFGHKSPDFIEI